MKYDQFDQSNDQTDNKKQNPNIIEGHSSYLLDENNKFRDEKPLKATWHHYRNNLRPVCP